MTCLEYHHLKCRLQDLNDSSEDSNDGTLQMPEQVILLTPSHGFENARDLLDIVLSLKCKRMKEYYVRMVFYFISSEYLELEQVST